MKRSKWSLLGAGVALTWISLGSAPASAQTIDVVRAVQAAQVDKTPVDLVAQANPQPAPPAAPATRSPMVKPPEAASAPGSQASPANPDNMPIKRPDTPTNDKMSRQPPASGANAK